MQIAGRPCDATETPFSDVSCYRQLSSNETVQQKAHRRCVDAGYHLPVITTDEERNFVADLYRTFGRIWADGTRHGSIWKWSTEEPFETINYQHSQYCLYLRSNDEKLVAYRCNQERNFVCERCEYYIKVHGASQQFFSVDV